MKRVGFRRVQRSGFVPHLTLLYDAHLVAERAVETVHINAASFVLVWSVRGRGHMATPPSRAVAAIAAPIDLVLKKPQRRCNRNSGRQFTEASLSREGC